MVGKLLCWSMLIVGLLVISCKESVVVVLGIQARGLVMILGPQIGFGVVCLTSFLFGLGDQIRGNCVVESGISNQCTNIIGMKREKIIYLLQKLDED